MFSHPSQSANKQSLACLKRKFGCIGVKKFVTILAIKSCPSFCRMQQISGATAVASEAAGCRKPDSYSYLKRPKMALLIGQLRRASRVPLNVKATRSIEASCPTRFVKPMSGFQRNRHAEEKVLRRAVGMLPHWMLNPPALPAVPRWNSCIANPSEALPSLAFHRLYGHCRWLSRYIQQLEVKCVLHTRGRPDKTRCKNGLSAGCGVTWPS